MSLFNISESSSPVKSNRKSIYVREGDDKIKLDIINEKALNLYRELEKKKKINMNPIIKSIYSTPTSKIRSSFISK